LFDGLLPRSGDLKLKFWDTTTPAIWGKGRPVKGKEKPANGSLKYGNWADYALARLKRDRPELADVSSVSPFLRP
jgi:hypothetical protein